MNNKEIILGIPIDFVDAKYLLSAILEWRQSGRKGYIVWINPHSIIQCKRHATFRCAVCDADLIAPDGVGITIAARFLGYGPRSRLPGPATTLDICNWGRSYGLRHYFFGGAEGIATRVAQNLTARYPGLNVVGTMTPPFYDMNPTEDEAIVQQIERASPDVVWVGLGTRKQEIWMRNHVGRLSAAALLGVGAAFDFHAGTVPWAPTWVRGLGIEWAYRLCHEPRRLWRRNLDSPLFLAKVIAERAWRGMFGNSPGAMISSPGRVVAPTAADIEANE